MPRSTRGRTSRRTTRSTAANAGLGDTSPSEDDSYRFRSATQPPDATDYELEYTNTRVGYATPTQLSRNRGHSEEPSTSRQTLARLTRQQQPSATRRQRQEEQLSSEENEQRSPVSRRRVSPPTRSRPQQPSASRRQRQEEQLSPEDEERSPVSRRRASPPTRSRPQQPSASRRQRQEEQLSPEDEQRSPVSRRRASPPTRSRPQQPSASRRQRQEDQLPPEDEQRSPVSRRRASPPTRSQPQQPSGSRRQQLSPADRQGSLVRHQRPLPPAQPPAGRGQPQRDVVRSNEPSTSRAVIAGATRARRRKRRTPQQLKVRFLKEVHRLQSSTQLMVPRLPFGRLVREILRQLNTEVYMFTRDSLEILQEATEMYMTQRLQDAYLLTLHRGRVTLAVQDLALITFLRDNP